MFKTGTRVWLVFPVLLLAAFALRIFNLQSQSLWYDEAFSVWLARMDLGAITARTAADIQPPLYYYLLHFWIALAGDSEFAVRFLSLVSGVLTVPLMYVTARRLFSRDNRAAAFLTALLALISPLYLWYSQEARMYTLITLLGLLSSYALLCALASGKRRWWSVFALSNIAGFYTHYFMAAVIAFQVLFVIGNWLLVIGNSKLRNAKEGPPLPTHHSPVNNYQLRTFLLSLLAIIVAFLPWLPLMLARLGEDASYWQGALKVDEAIRHIAISFSMGESVLEATAQWLAVGWFAVLLVGLAAWLVLNWKRARREGGGVAFAALYLLVPLALLLVLFYRNPKFNARYLMLASPGLMLLLAAGLAGLWSGMRTGRIATRVAAGALLGLGAAFLFGTAAYADTNAYFDPAFTKADFRGVAQFVESHANPDEAIILSSGHLFPAFDYYYTRADLPELRLPDDPTLNAEHVLGLSTADELNRVVAGKKGVWVVQWQDEVVDPNGVVPLLLSSQGQEQKLGASFWQLKLRHWTLPERAHFSDEPKLDVVSNANYKNKIELLGLSQNPTPADRGASFNLYWQALDTLNEDYQVALRVVDAQGNLWGKQDRRPAGYTYPSLRWKKGEIVPGSFSVPLLPGTPAGDYYVTATLFTAADQTGLDVLAANGAPVGRSVKLGPIKVLPAEKQPAWLDLKFQHALSLRSGPFTLIGYNLDREKASTGESIPMTFFWRADEPPVADYTFTVQFADEATAPLPLANAAYPTSQWRAGEIVRSQVLIRVPPNASAGATNIKLRLSGPSPQVLDLLQPFTIEKTDRVYVEPASAHKQAASFGEAIELVGYDVSASEIRAGDMLTVTLNWKADKPTDKPYTAFVHLLGSDGKPWGQKDAQPLNGARPTTTWTAGEYLSDPLAFQVKPDAPPGEYRIEIGWYDASDPSFARLPVTSGNGGDSVVLTQKIVVRVKQ